MMRFWECINIKEVRMKINYKIIMFAMLAAVSLFLVPAHNTARAEGELELVLTDVTASDTSTLAGESKILVSVEGSAEKASIVQIGFTFGGELKYKSIRFIAGKNAPDEGKYVLSTDVSAANREKNILTGIVSVNESIPLSGRTELFVLTFAGEAGQTGSMEVNTDNTYVMDGKTERSISGGGIGLTASETGVQAVDARIEFVVKGQDAEFYPKPKVGDPESGSEEYAEINYKSGIFIDLTDTETGSVFKKEIDMNPISKGGNLKSSAEDDEFLITETLVSGRAYDITVSGEGYETYTAEDHVFTGGEPLRITSDDIAPLIKSKYEQSRNTAYFYVYSGEQRELKGYLASYNAAGRLISAVSAKLGSGSVKNLKLNSGAAAYRAFIWTDNKEPAEPDSNTPKE